MTLVSFLHDSTDGKSLGWPTVSTESGNEVSSDRIWDKIGNRETLHLLNRSTDRGTRHLRILGSYPIRGLELTDHLPTWCQILRSWSLPDPWFGTYGSSPHLMSDPQIHRVLSGFYFHFVEYQYSKSFAFLLLTDFPRFSIKYHTDPKTPLNSDIRGGSWV